MIRLGSEIFSGATYKGENGREGKKKKKRNHAIKYNIPT